MIINNFCGINMIPNFYNQFNKNSNAITLIIKTMMINVIIIVVILFLLSCMKEHVFKARRELIGI